jgi:hypothetical protein
MKKELSNSKFSSFAELSKLNYGAGVKRYHINIGFPKGIILPKGIINFRFSIHAKKSILYDKYSNEPLNVSSYLNLAYTQIFEVFVEENRVKKFVCKTAYNFSHNITLVVAIKTNQVYILCTCWLNEKGDNHKTLNQAIYDKP